jgi:hypothetical protein
MRSLHALVAAAAVLLLALGSLDFLQGGWDAVAGGLALLSAMAFALAYAILVSQART